MTFTLNQAIEHLYSSVLRRDEALPPMERTIIFDDATIEKPWGWILFYNNEKYYRTRNASDAHVGAGPLFFNRHNGEVRKFGSGCNLDAEIYDYEMELEACGSYWCLSLSNGQSRQETILKIKQLLRVETATARNMIPSLPHPLFTGIRRHLDWMKRQFDNAELLSHISLEPEHPNCKHFEIPRRFEHVSNISAYHAYHDDWRPDW